MTEFVAESNYGNFGIYGNHGNLSGSPVFL